MVALFFSGATAQAKSEDLSVMSFNLRGKETDEAGDFSWASRKKGCLKAIKKFDPDVLFLQEAYGYHKEQCGSADDRLFMAKRPLQGTAIAFGKPCGDAAVLLLAVEVGFVGED